MTGALHVEEVVGLFDSLRKPLLRYLLTFGVSPADSEEIIQESFLALFKHLSAGRGRENLAGWLFRVCHNLALKHREKSRLLPQVASDVSVPIDSSPNPEEQFAQTQRQQKLQAVLRALPEQDRCCITLRAEGLRYREIAEILGMSLGAVSISLTRSLSVSNGRIRSHLMSHSDPHLSDNELLLAVDGELPPQRDAEVRGHLHACWACRKRMQEVEANIASFIGGYQSSLDSQIPPSDGTRLRTMLLNQSLPEKPSGLRWRWGFSLAATLLVLCGLLLMRHTASDLTTPDPRLTPGETTIVSKQQLCQASSGTENGPVPESLRQAVFAEYGLAKARRDAYEVDYLITPGLGGSASLRNLWPQSYSKREWNAYAKDALERRMHSMVCDGNLDLSTAQREIATNWVGAYKKYVGDN